MEKLLEVCVDSYASAMAAIQGGADRLELCSALSVGGLTPSAALVHQIRLVSDIRVRCLMRPRAGDFLYTKEEISQMVSEMEALKAAGTSGFVIGCLTPEGELDEIAMAPLLEAAKGFGLTLHRCIDVSRNLGETYQKAAGLGFDTVLTSGGRKMPGWHGGNREASGSSEGNRRPPGAHRRGGERPGDRDFPGSISPGGGLPHERQKGSGKRHGVPSERRAHGCPGAGRMAHSGDGSR